MAGKVQQFSTKMPDGRLLALRLDIQRSEDEESSTTRNVYEIDGEEVTKAQAQKAYDAQPEHWQRGRTFQQMIDFWLGRQPMMR
jgi:hypothetical protein